MTIAVPSKENAASTGEKAYLCDFRLLTAKDFDANVYLYLKSASEEDDSETIGQTRVSAHMAEPHVVSNVCAGVGEDKAETSVEHMVENGICERRGKWLVFPRMKRPFVMMSDELAMWLACNRRQNVSKMYMYMNFQIKSSLFKGMDSCPFSYQGVAKFVYGYSDGNINGTVRKRMRGYVKQLEDDGLVKTVEVDKVRKYINWVSTELPVD